MSQRDVERTLGRLLTDAGFRRDVFRNPAGACREFGPQLAAHEVQLGLHGCLSSPISARKSAPPGRQFRSAPFESVGAGDGGEQEVR